MKPEQAVKNSIMNYLRGQANVKCWVNNTQGSPVKGGGFHKSPNSIRGVSDILGYQSIGETLPDAIFIGIETKSPQGLKKWHKEKDTYNTTAWWQNMFLTELSRDGGIAIITDSLDDFILQWDGAIRIR